MDPWITEGNEFEHKSYLKPTLCLGMRAYMAWMQREMMYTADEAKAKFKAAYHDQLVRKRFEDGMWKLAVAGHSVEIHERGTIEQKRKEGDGAESSHSRILDSPSPHPPTRRVTGATAERVAAHPRIDHREGVPSMAVVLRNTSALVLGDRQATTSAAV